MSAGRPQPPPRRMRFDETDTGHRLIWTGREWRRTWPDRMRHFFRRAAFRVQDYQDGETK